jgi:hypothetical protein
MFLFFRFLATGDSFSTIGHSFRMGFSTVSSIVAEVCDVIWQRLQPTYMPQPTAEIWEKAISGFQEKWGRSPHQKMSEVTPSDGDLVALQNATMAIGRSRRPRGPTYARGTNRSLFEDPELADNARHLATRRAHPAFKFFYVAHSGSGSFIF